MSNKKGVSTTFEQRVEIAEYCINHMYNYTLTAKEFGVSYSQARTYTHKYEANGPEGLINKRRKKETQENEALQAEIKRLRDENTELKKARELALTEMTIMKKMLEMEYARLDAGYKLSGPTSESDK